MDKYVVMKKQATVKHYYDTQSKCTVLYRSSREIFYQKKKNDKKKQKKNILLAGRINK